MFPARELRRRLTNFLNLRVPSCGGQSGSPATTFNYHLTVPYLAAKVEDPECT